MSATYHCDRCGNPILADRCNVSVKSGRLIYLMADVDLCDSCAESLGHWLRQPVMERQAQEAAAVGSCAR